MKLKKYNQLIESFISLSLLNALNVLLPLITLPYLLRVIGPERYGIYAFVYAIIQYILLIGNYGFNYSATKQISQSRDNMTYVSIIYSSVIVARLFLTICGILFFLFLSHFLLDSPDKLLIFFLGLGIVLGDVFIPVWLFQGLEKMRYLTLVNVASKLLFTVLIFFVVKISSDYIYIIMLNSLGFLFAGLCSIIIVYKFIGLKFHIPKWIQVVSQLKKGSVIFGSTLSMELYRNSNIFILGFFVSDSFVGIYSAAEKIIKGVQGVISPAAQALFPHLSFKFRKQTFRENLDLLYKVSKIFAIILLIMTVLTFLGAKYISDFLGGIKFNNSIPLIRIMSTVIFLGGLNYLIGIVGLINLNKQKAFLNNVAVSGLFAIIFLLLGVNYWGVYAAAYSMVICELILLLMCIRNLYLIKEKNK